MANRFVELLDERSDRDKLISKLRAALKGCLPTLEDALQDATSLSTKELRLSPSAIHGYKASAQSFSLQIAEIRALLGEDARKEGL